MGIDFQRLNLPFQFKDYILRSVSLDDIEKAYSMRKKVAEESDTILSTPDEITLEGMTNWIKNWLSMETKLFLVAEYAHDIVGQLWVWFLDNKKKTAHVAEFGMEIVIEHRGKGLGSKFTEIAIDWAKSNGAIRIEAETLEKNIPMRKILEKYGFQLEGKKRCYLKNSDTYENVVFYGKILKEQECIEQNFQR